MADEPAHHLTARERAADTAHTVRIVLAVLLAVALVALAAANTDDVHVDYLVGDTDAPLVVVVAASALVGALIAALVRVRRHHEH